MFVSFGHHLSNNGELDTRPFHNHSHPKHNEGPDKEDHSENLCKDVQEMSHPSEMPYPL